MILSRSQFFPSATLPSLVFWLWVLVFVVSWLHDGCHSTRYHTFTTASQGGKEKSEQKRGFPFHLIGQVQGSLERYLSKENEIAIIGLYWP